MNLDLFVDEKVAHAHPLRRIAKEPAMPSIKTEAWTFVQMTGALRVLALELPATSTIRQALTFTMILEKISMGHDTIIAEIRKEAGADAKGMELLGQSIGRSYQQFLAPSKKNADGLGWLELETDEDDNRRKVLRLTKKGEAVALKIAKALKEKP